MASEVEDYDLRSVSLRVENEKVFCLGLNKTNWVRMTFSIT